MAEVTLAEKIDPILWDFRSYATLFRDPVELVFPGPDGVERHMVGDGLGGFSRLFFSRGVECPPGCGRCCMGIHNRVWLYFEADRRPPELEPFDIKINGYHHRVFLHINREGLGGDCHYLTKDDNKFCQVHESGKSMHCIRTPTTTTYPYRGRRYWTKRHPPRNWRWPHCIAKLDGVPPNIEEDIGIFEVLRQTFRKMPGHCTDQVISGMPDFYDLKYFDQVTDGSARLDFERFIR